MQREQPSKRRPWWWRDLLTSTGLLTRLPVPSADSDDRPAMRAAWCFPLVGLAVGGIAGAVALSARHVGIPDLAAGFAAIISAVLLTGALHEDGLADTCDGLGGGGDRDSKIAIMRDSRIGAYGVLALVLAIGLKAAALDTLLSMAGWRPVVIGLVIAHAAARAAMVGVAAVLHPASCSGLGYQAGRPPIATTVCALGVVVIVLAALLPGAVALAVGTSACGAAALVGWLAYRQIGGYTGDVLGAVEQIAETVILLTVAAVCAHYL